MMQVDIRGEQIGRRAPVDLALVGDGAGHLAALLPRLQPKTDAPPRRPLQSTTRKTRQKLDDLATPARRGAADAPAVRGPARSSELAAQDAVFIPDVGTPVVWAARYLRMNGRRRLLGSFSHGSMANAVPQAIGVQAAGPGPPGR